MEPLLVTVRTSCAGDVPASTCGPGSEVPFGGVRIRGRLTGGGRLRDRLGLPPDARDQEVLAAVHEGRAGVDVADVEGPAAWVYRDGPRNHLEAVRDRVGNHSLFYLRSRGSVHVSDRVEPLLETADRPPSPNRDALVRAIHGRGPAPGETAYREIAAVRPGWTLTVRGGRIAERCYWRLEPFPAHPRRNGADPAEELRELLWRVLRDHLPTSEAGVTLSGGLDSTSVAAAARAVAPGARLVAFPWTSPDLPAADESRSSREVQELLGMEWRPIRADLGRLLPDGGGLGTEREGPLLNPYRALWSRTYAEAEAAGIDTVLTGVSGDHLFGENVFAYPDLLLTGRWVELARQLRRHLSWSERTLVQIVRRMILRPLLEAYSRSWQERLCRAVPWVREPYGEMHRDSFASARPPQAVLPGRLARLRLLADETLPETVATLNRQAADRGVRLVHPLLDHRLVELAARLPTDQTFEAAEYKVVLRRAMEGRLPPRVLRQRSKVLPTPWLDRELQVTARATVEGLMTGMRLSDLGIVDEGRLREHYAEYLAGRHRSPGFWFTLCVEDWLRRYF